MIQPAFEILNQRGTPMFFSDVFANRPTAGIVGRIFISTDTYAFYRDTGTGWDLIGGPGTGTITGSGTIGTLPIWNGTQVIGDSSLLEGASKFTTTKDFQTDAFYLNGMTAGNGALYWTSDRVTLANYNPTGDVRIEVGGGVNAQTISGTNYSTTFYGNIIRNGGLSTQFLKADGSLDSSAYVTTNIYNSNGTITGNRVVSLNSNYLSFAGGQTYIGSQTASSGLLTINNSNSDAHLQVVGASAPSIRIDNAGTGATQRFVIGLSTATNNFIQGSTAGDICISTASASPLLFGMWQSINASEVMRISTSNNLLIGTSVDLGFKLLVSGTGRFTGALTGTSATFNGDLIVNTGTGATFRATIDSTNRVEIGNFSSASGYRETTFASSVIRLSTGTAGGSSVTTRFTIDATGNAGLGVSPSTWNSNSRALQLPQFVSLSTQNDASLNLMSFALETSANTFTYADTGVYPLRYSQNPNTGVHAWFNAPTGTAGNAITFIQAMTINSSGQLSIGTTAATNDLNIYNVNNAGITLQSSYTGTTSNDGFYIGQIFGSTNFLFRQRELADIVFQVNNGDRVLTITTAQNVLIGTSTDAGQRLYLNGSLRIDGQRSGTAGGASGQHLIIVCDGTTYKIALLNP